MEYIVNYNGRSIQMPYLYIQNTSNDTRKWRSRSMAWHGTDSFRFLRYSCLLLRISLIRMDVCIMGRKVKQTLYFYSQSIPTNMPMLHIRPFIIKQKSTTSTRYWVIQILNAFETYNSLNMSTIFPCTKARTHTHTDSQTKCLTWSYCWRHD